MLLAEERTPLEANWPVEVKIPCICSHIPVCAASCHCFKGQGRNKKASHQKTHPVNFYLNFQRQSKRADDTPRQRNVTLFAQLCSGSILSSLLGQFLQLLWSVTSQEFCCSQNKSDVLPNIQRQKRLHCSTKWLKIAIIMNYLGYFQACIQVKVRKPLRRWFRE